MEDATATAELACALRGTVGLTVRRPCVQMTAVDVVFATRAIVAVLRVTMVLTALIVNAKTIASSAERVLTELGLVKHHGQEKIAR